MKNYFPSPFRAVAFAAFAVVAHPSFAQVDYSTPYTVSKFAGLTGIAGANDGTINYAQLNLPIGEAFDGSGNLYVADSGNQTIRKISPTGISATFAGAAGNLGTSDGTGSNARFSTPSGLAIDAAGNVYVSDSGNHTIRKISPAGAVTTLAGSAGNSGTADGTGSVARFNNPIGLALTTAGDLLVADSNNHTIRKVTVAGVVTTFAGAAGTAGSADGTGTGATFHNPHSVALDASGNLWVSDSGNHTIRRITAAGVVTTFAGAAGSAGSTDGSGSAARFSTPQGLAFDASGNLFVADWGNSLLRKISPAGAVTTFAGSAGPGRFTDGTGTSARFQSPAGLAFDSSGTLYVSDYYNHTIRKVTATAIVTTWIGSPPRAGSANGIGAAGLFQNPYGIAVDSSRNVYVADQVETHTIRKITADGVVSTLAGLAGVHGSADGTGSMALFYSPAAVAVDSSGNVYVADKDNHTIRKITAAGVVTTLAGSAGNLGTADGTGSAARFFSPQGVAVDASGNVYVADSGNGTIRKITSAGVVTTLAGTPLSYGSTDGTGSAARFYSPTGIALDSGGNIFVADTANGTIRKITTPAGVVTTIAGQAGSPGARDGTGTAASFLYPVGIAADASGNVFVADYGNNTIRLISAAGVVKTVAGGLRGDDDGAGQVARFADPTGVAVDSLGTLYVADSSNNLIRRGLAPGAASFSAQPTSQAVALGQSATFTVAASGSGLTYQWQKSGTSISGATSASYTIPSPQAADAGSYAVLVTSGGITAASMPATLTVGSAVSNNTVSITTQPASQSVTAGQSVTFTVAASGSSLTYQWQKNSTPISGATNASFTISSAQAADAASYTVVVTSGSTSATSSTAVLTVTGAIPTAHLINLSILTQIVSPGDFFTVGYVVGNSSPNTPLQLLVRAAGPALSAFGVGGLLNDPKLELYASSTKTGENDNWGGTPVLINAIASVGAFTYANPASLDAAALANITSSDNSVKVSAADNGTGAVIAEVYDTTPSANFTSSGPRLINLSVLKNLGSGFTIGFVIRGTGTKSIIVRAVGPGLANVGVASGFADDPQVTLIGTGVQLVNDNWGGTPALTAAFAAVGAFVLPPASKDAALLATLAPGDYTAQVAGTGNTNGLVLVEVYEVP